MIKYLNEHPDDESVKRFRKKNTITAGPSGSGKTYCVEVLGDFLQVPTLIIDATDYTEAGYVGKSVDDMIRELIDLAPGQNRQEQTRFISKYGGLVFIDEIDKKAKDGTAIGHDISREGFQRSVLKLIERKSVKSGGVIFINSSLIPIRSGHDDVDELIVPVNDIAVKIGSVKSANIVALSAFIVRSSIVDFDLLRASVIQEFSEKENLIPINLAALEEGRKIALQ
jgi:ATP-dependent protease HslVU (ClpYQ) ATPase subunit